VEELSGGACALHVRMFYTDPHSDASLRPARGEDKENPGIAGPSWEAAEGARTLDLLHGKQTLFQLSYSRTSCRL
jgi:hypothetical protein